MHRRAAQHVFVYPLRLGQASGLLQLQALLQSVLNLLRGVLRRPWGWARRQRAMGQSEILVARF